MQLIIAKYASLPAPFAAAYCCCQNQYPAKFSSAQQRGCSWQKTSAATKVSAGVALANITAAVHRSSVKYRRRWRRSFGGGGAGATTVQPPDFNIIGSTGVNQLAEAIGSTEKEPLRAYVVSSDITTKQALDRNIRSSAEL